MSVDLKSDDLGATGASLPARIGPFNIIDRIGRGGMGVVLDAHTDDGKRVALKLIRPAGTAEDQRVLVARLLREAAAIARLDHPGVVRLIRYGNAEGNVYLAMDFVVGVTLKDIQRRTSIDAVTLLSLGTQILATLAHLHASGIIHRDVKPDNILITNEGRSVLADFGIAWHPDAAGITRPGEIIGSVGYLAPECIEGGTPTPASDIYALGRTLFELAALFPRARLDPRTPILDRFALRMVVDWDRFPKAPPWESIRLVLERMVAHDLKDRFESAEDCAAAFRELTRIVRPDLPGSQGKPRDMNEIGDDFTCFEPAATLSAFVDHLGLPTRSVWEATDDAGGYEVSTLPPGARRPSSRRQTQPDRPDPDFVMDDTTHQSKDLDLEATIANDQNLDDARETDAQVPVGRDVKTDAPQARRDLEQDEWGSETPLPVLSQGRTTPRLPATRRTQPEREAGQATPIPASPSTRRRVWPAVLLGLLVGTLGGAASAWYVERATIPAHQDSPDETAGRAALDRANQRLSERDFGAARVELERCIALADLDACHQRLEILLALRGDPAARRHER